MSGAMPQNTEEIFDSKTNVRIYRQMLRKEFLQLLCFILVPVFLLGSMVVNLINANLINLKSEEAERQTNYIESQLDTILGEIESINLSFCVNPEITSIFTRAYDMNNSTNYVTELNKISYNYLLPTVTTHSYIRSLYIYCDNTMEYFLTDRLGLVRIHNYLDNAWYRTYLQMKQTETNYYIETRTHKEYAFEDENHHYVTLYRRLFLRNGVIVMNLDQDYFNQLLTKQCDTKEHALFVCDRNNSLIFFSNTSPIPDEDTIGQLQSMDDQSLTSVILGDKQYYIIKSLINDRYGLYSYSVIPYSYMYDLSNRFIKDLIGFGLLIIVLGLLITKRQANRRIQNAMRIMEALKSETPEQYLSATGTKGNDYYDLVIRQILTNYIERNRLEKQLEIKQNILHETELTALKHQINPHFMFNTLKTIYWMSISLTGSVNDVSRMTEDMTEILEYSLNTSDDFATISEEIDITKSYIDIQLKRYQNRFAVEWDYDETVKQYCIVKLILQPLIENSIIHGINWMKNDLLQIKISIKKDGDHILFSIFDNGIGIPDDKLSDIRDQLQSQTDNGHIGLLNCHKRLCLTYGPASGISIINDLGTKLTFIIPAISSMVQDSEA